MPYRPLIVDSDGGLDDAQALIMLIGNGRAPDHITTVFGNVSLDQATTNLLDVTATLGVSIPVYKGADRPLVQPLIDAKEIHGDDGLGGAPRPSRREEPQRQGAVHLFLTVLKAAAAAATRVDILMIGPLTNLALALRLDPRIVDGIGTLTVLGGTVYGRGNTTPFAEFNVYADPEAAHIVLTAGIETVVVPWETCTAHYMEGQRVDDLFAGVPRGPVRDFARIVADQSRAWTGLDRLIYGDSLAAALVIDPTIITKAIVAASSVSLAPGLTRGMTLVDPSRGLGTPDVAFVEAVDVARVDALYAASIAFAGVPRLRRWDTSS